MLENIRDTLYLSGPFYEIGGEPMAQLVKYIGGTECIISQVSEKEGEDLIITLFPNPTSSSFRIEATRPQEVRSIEIYNATGQLMAHCTAMPNDIDARQWPSGCYSVLVKYDNEVVRSKVVVE